MTESPSSPSPKEDIPELAELTDLAVDLARQAGEITLGYFQRGVTSDFKSDGTPVTVADREAETFLRDELQKRFPDDGLFGEEHGKRDGTSGRTWVLDPIDGTRAFVHGVPIWGVLVGLVTEAQGPVLGVVHLPALGDTVWAHRGGGAFWNGRPSKVTTTNRLDQSLLLMTDVPDATTRERLAPLVDAGGVRRTWGDCYGYVLVATGRADLMIDPVVNPWDVAAIQPIIEEAGGRFTDLGGEATYRGGNALATNGLLHAGALEHLAQGSR